MAVPPPPCVRAEAREKRAERKEIRSHSHLCHDTKYATTVAVGKRPRYDYKHVGLGMRPQFLSRRELEVLSDSTFN